MPNLAKYKKVVVGIFAVLAPIVAYLFQVDPLSLCKPNSASLGGGSVTTQLDAGVDVK